VVLPHHLLLFIDVGFLISALCHQGCYNGGTCTLPGTCTCAFGWSGENCTTGRYIFAKWHALYQCEIICFLEMYSSCICSTAPCIKSSIPHCVTAYCIKTHDYDSVLCVWLGSIKIFNITRLVK